MIKRTQYIDDASGEICSTQVQHIAAAWREDQGYLFWARKSYSKSFQDVPYPPGMSTLEIGQMAVLAKKIWSNTNMLGYRGNGGVRPYDTDDIARILAVGMRRAQQFVRKMIRLGMLARVEIRTEDRQETQYYVNPIYFFSSNRIPLGLYLIFRAELDRVMPAWVRDEYARKKSKGV